MFMLHVRSTKLSFVFENQKSAVSALQQKFEECWTSLGSFPVAEARGCIRDLRVRLKDFLLCVHTEIVVERQRKSAVLLSVARSTPNSPVKSPSKKLSVSALNGDGGLIELVSKGVFSLREVTDISSAVFGDAFGSCWQSYSSSLQNHKAAASEIESEQFHKSDNSQMNFFQNNFSSLGDSDMMDPEVETGVDHSLIAATSYSSEKGTPSVSGSEDKHKRSRL